MVINRSAHDDGYVCISTSILRDTSISIAARGLICMLLANSSTWRLTLTGLCTQTGLCRTTIQRLMRELRDAGYVETRRVHGDGGRLLGCEWVINEDKTESAIYRQTEKPTVGKTDRRKNRQTEKPTVGKIGSLININSNNYQYKEISKVISNKVTRFRAPSRSDVYDFAVSYEIEKGNGATQQVDKFMDYYTANGWKVGRNSMKDWRAAFRNWCNRDFNTTSTPKSAQPLELDWEEIARAASEGIGGNE